MAFLFAAKCYTPVRPIPLLSVYWNGNYIHKIVSGDKLVILKDRGKKRNDKAPYPFIICLLEQELHSQNC